MSSRQSPRQGRRRSSRQESGEERIEAEVGKQQAQRRSRRRSVSRDSLLEPGSKVETGGRKGYSPQQEQEGVQQRKAREERGRVQSKEELREPRGGRRVEEGQAAGAKQSLAGEFIDFYLGRAKK